MSVDEFVSALSAHADATDQRAVRPIIDRLCRPTRVRVTGRPGVGRRTLAAALGDAGLTVTDNQADVEVLVVAEAAKPEDCQFIAASTGPIVFALNKADLLGAAVPGRLGLIRRITGVAAVPVSALWATATLDGPLIAALRVLAADPGDLSSTDAFCAAPHAVDGATRARLLAVADLTGIAAATAALRAGADGRALTASLRRSSNIDQMVTAVHTATAALRYRRLCAAMTRLRAVAARTADRRLDAMLAGDAAVLAAMEAAAEVIRADGLDTGPEDPLRRAVHWQRYSRGPVNALHRRCGADIARGALRSGVL